MYHFQIFSFLIRNLNISQIFAIIELMDFQRNFQRSNITSSKKYYYISFILNFLLYLMRAIGQNLLLYQTSSRGFSTRYLVEIFYQTSSSRKIATYQMSTRKSKYLLDIQQQKNSSTRRPVEFLLDIQQNFYQTSSRPDDLGHYQICPSSVVLGQSLWVDSCFSFVFC